VDKSGGGISTISWPPLRKVGVSWPPDPRIGAYGSYSATHSVMGLESPYSSGAEPRSVIGWSTSQWYSLIFTANRCSWFTITKHKQLHRVRKTPPKENAVHTPYITQSDSTYTA